MPDVRAVVRVIGRVQGVWFRQSTKNVADRHNVTGWVRNNPDHSVAAIFEGERTAVQAVIDWCRRGPEMAHVEELQTEWQASSGEFDQFQILR